MEEIKIGKYILYNLENKRFYLTNDAQYTIYREKGIICSYSGSNEWCHHFFCQMIDLYSSGSPFNYSLDSFDHEKRFPEIAADKIFIWIEKNKENEWWQKMVQSFEYVFDNLPNDQ